MSLALSSSLQDGVCRIEVTGEVDVSNAAELRQAIDDAFDRDKGGMEIDLAQVSYIDSTGIGVLVGAAHRASEERRQFVVANPQRNVVRVLTLLGVDEQLGVRA